MRTYARIDANQPLLVDLFQRAGAMVQSLAAMGNGVPDLLVGYNGTLVLVEVKDGSKPPSARKLTPDERKWHERWAGYPVHVISNHEEALALLRQMQEVSPR